MGLIDSVEAQIIEDKNEEYKTIVQNYVKSLKAYKQLKNFYNESVEKYEEDKQAIYIAKVISQAYEWMLRSNQSAKIPEDGKFSYLVDRVVTIKSFEDQDNPLKCPKVVFEGILSMIPVYLLKLDGTSQRERRSPRFLSMTDEERVQKGYPTSNEALYNLAKLYRRDVRYWMVPAQGFNLDFIGYAKRYEVL